MMNTKIKTTAIALLVAANVAYFVWARVRRPELPTSMQQWEPLANLTPEERGKRVASYFTPDDFHIKPLAAESGFVTIPRAKKWREQAIVSIGYVNAQPVTIENKDKDSPKDGGSNLPWKAGAIKVKITSISVSSYETVETPDTNHILIKEKVISRDGFMTKNGLEVPLMQLVGVSQYTVDVKEGSLHSVKGATMINGTAGVNLTAEVPHWLVPKRKIAIGETWVQVGALPITVPDTAPRPEVRGTLKRLVMFEGRRAAEVSSTATIYDFSPGPKADPIKHEEERLVYFDLETGEPLWYEFKSKGDREFEAVIRGCNQNFTKQLIPTPIPTITPTSNT